MKFNEKLNKLILELNISNAYLAKFSNIDPSLISRLRTGKRIPSNNSNQIKCIAKGFELIAKKDKLESKIMEICDNKHSKISDAIIEWFYKEDSNLKKERKVREVKSNRDEIIRLKTFTGKLNTLMTELNISNIKLAKGINIDTSLVSRYRSGKRIPSDKNRIVNDICEFVIKYNLNKVANILNIDSNNIKKEEVFKRLLDWFLEEKKELKTTSIDKFLESIDTFNLDTNLALTLSSDMLRISNGSIKEFEVYHDEEGLRNAVLRFLTSIAKENENREILFYSDESIDWLTRDKTFTKKWAMLMFYILNKKNNIKIIHNINRNINEIIEEIENWIPFYMTANVVPYYFKNNNDNHFSHTIMVADNLSSVYSSHVYNSSAEVSYYYSNYKSEVKNMSEQFKVLLSYCDPLMKQYTKDHKKEYINDLKQFEYSKTKTKTLLSTLPLYTMPYSLLESILEKNNIDNVIKKELIEYYQNRVNAFNENILNYKHIDYCQINSLKDKELVIDIPEIIIKKSLYYDEKDLIEHIKNIDNISKKNSNYVFKTIKETNLNNLSIIYKENTGVFLIKNSNPSVALNISHNIICSAIETFIENKK